MTRRRWTDEDWNWLEPMHAAGCPTAKIARDMGRPKNVIFAKRAIPRREGRPMADGESVRKTDPDLYHPSRDKLAWRKCMGGRGRPFGSFGPRHRICNPCKGASASVGESALPW